MGSLKARLDQIKEGFVQHAPKETQAIVARATEELRASGILERIPVVGDPMPPFALPASDGRVVRSADLLAQGPLIVSFYRGAWCPYCNAELEALQEHYGQILTLGAELVAISPQTVRKSAVAKRKHHLEFPILSDAQNAYAKELSIVFTLPEAMRHVYRDSGVHIPDFNGDDSWELPMPTRIVVDRDGVIRSIEAEADYMQRLEPQATLDALQEKIRSTSHRLLHSLHAELEAERRRSHELLLNLLPAPIAAELKREGSVQPVSVDAATVLFTDIHGFTASAAHLSACEVVARLNECFTAFDEIVSRHAIEKLKTIGDAYMCAGGLLGDGEDHTRRMVRAAFEMRDWAQAWCRDQAAGGEDGWAIRIGIHRGPLVAGVIGTQKMAYDVWGDTVNVAARLESSGEIGKVNVSREVVEAVGDECAVEARGCLPLKNRGDFEMFFVEPSL